MLKSYALYSVCFLILVVPSACTEGNKGDAVQSRKDSSAASSRVSMLAPGADTSFISIDTANKMIGSYLASVQGGGMDTNLHSLLIDANALREYLNSDSGSAISHMKILFAHRLSYINNGGKNQPCGYSPYGLTVVLAGVDGAGNYVYYQGNSVDDMSRPCPYNCITEGTASNDLLVR